MALSSSIGLILEIFSIKEDIELQRVRKFIEPKISISDFGCEKKPDAVFGVEYIKGYEDGIYALYDGKCTFAQALSNRNRLLFQNIAVFDWTGEPKTLYVTDYRVMNMCLLDRYLYAVLKDINGNCFIGRALL